MARCKALQSFSETLSLDPLTADPELVGREIRNHLDAAGVRERHCVVCVPLKWALVVHVELPELPEADVASFLQIEAERGFPCDIATLRLATSRWQAPSGKQYATLIGIPENHLALLERVLQGARLKAVSFSLGISALQPPDVGSSDGALALAIGEDNIDLQITCGGGVVALRALEGALEIEGTRKLLHSDIVAREARITLGQLPSELRETVRSVRIFGPAELARELADEIGALLRARDLTRQLLTFARGGAPVKRLTRVDTVVREAAVFATRGSAAFVSVEVADDLWPAEVDEGQIGQVIQNIVINAVQAMPSGGGITVRVTNAAVEPGSSHPVPARGPMSGSPSGTRASASLTSSSKRSSTRTSPRRRPAAAWGSPPRIRSSGTTRDTSRFHPRPAREAHSSFTCLQ